MNYRHSIDGAEVDLPVGKVVCVGRNYAAHAKELNNPVPTEPVLFIKPNTSIVSLAESIFIPTHLGQCHFETEMSILIGTQLGAGCNEEQAQAAIAGVGLALDLTLRELQQQLKDKSLPWEKAKSFDGACPASEFVSASRVANLQNQQIQLHQNQQLRQDGNSADMLTPVLPLLVYISQFFTLMPGDMVLTGTPAGVGPLAVGDQLHLSLSDLIQRQTQICATV
ncbi:MAG: fumarylacetoacetate hydrolase family protein [Porticoccaceae bacterium]|nr:fumarylacetoacetate hydrolase family protein [Porticoccaceae bacterium]MDG1310637.1 fumarylacetoacetate hydrolase family protein [Porticoccaceae bacterium]